MGNAFGAHEVSVKCSGVTFASFGAQRLRQKLGTDVGAINAENAVWLFVLV